MSEEAPSTVIVEDLGPGAVLVRIDRPEARNALDIPTRVALAAAFDWLGSDPDVRAIVGAALRNTDERTRQVVVLHHLHGMTQEEVAVATRYSRKTVGKKLDAFAQMLQAAWRSNRGAA